MRLAKDYLMKQKLWGSISNFILFHLEVRRISMHIYPCKYDIWRQRNFDGCCFYFYLNTTCNKFGIKATLMKIGPDLEKLHLTQQSTVP
jgi:hypothetical protein